MSWCMCKPVCVERIRTTLWSQFLFPPFCGSQGKNSAHPICSVSTLPAEPSHWPLYCFLKIR